MGKYKRGIYFSLSILVLSLGLLQGQQAVVNASGVGTEVIPEDSIRLRILANSNTNVDQEVKRMIRDEVNAQITQWVEELQSIEQARDKIKAQLPIIEKIVANKMKELKLVDEFKVEFGNVFFPTKLYGEYVYPAGEYEAVLITIGEGQGNNWWCVLFPPLCFLDFENGDAVKKEESNKSLADIEAENNIEEDKSSEQIEVKFFLVEWFEGLIDSLKNV